MSDVIIHSDGYESYDLSFCLLHKIVGDTSWTFHVMVDEFLLFLSLQRWPCSPPSLSLWNHPRRQRPPLRILNWGCRRKGQKSSRSFFRPRMTTSRTFRCVSRRSINLCRRHRLVRLHQTPNVSSLYTVQTSFLISTYLVGPGYRLGWSFWKHERRNRPFPSTVQEPPGHRLDRLAASPVRNIHLTFFILLLNLISSIDSSR